MKQKKYDVSAFPEGADKWAAQVLEMPDEICRRYQEFSGPDARARAQAQAREWKKSFRD